MEYQSRFNQKIETVSRGGMARYDPRALTCSYSSSALYHNYYCHRYHSILTLLSRDLVFALLIIILVCLIVVFVSAHLIYGIHGIEVNAPDTVSLLCLLLLLL